MEIRAGGMCFHAQEIGTGDVTLVLLHYFGGSSRSWQEMLPGLCGAYRCLALDLRGCGDSDAPQAGYEVHAQAEDVAAVLQECGVTRYVLVGHSMGGKIAMELASRRPPGLEGLVLLAPSPPIPEPMPEEKRQQSLAGHGKRSVAEKTVQEITVSPLTDVLRERVLADNLRTSEPAWRGWLEIGSREDIAAQMKAIDVPSLLVLGERDPVMDGTMLRREAAARLAACTVETIADTGHLLPLEAPEETARIMTAWLLRILP